MRQIFTAEQLEQLLPIQHSTPKIDLDNSRAKNLREAFTAIQDDRKTHEQVRKYFREAEGFVLDFQADCYSPPFLKLNLHKPNDRDFLLIVTGTQSYLAVGELHEYKVVDGLFGKETPVKVYIPNQNDAIQMRNAGAELLLNPSNYALFLLYLRGTIADRHQDTTRKWQLDPTDREKYIFPITGEDLLFFYKRAIETAVTWQDKVNQTPSWQRPSLGNIRFFNRNDYPTRGLATKVSYIKKEPLFYE